MKKLFNAISPYILIFVLIVFVALIVSNYVGKNAISYSDFLTELRAQNVKSVELEDREAVVELSAASGTNEKLKAGKYKMKVLDPGVFEQLMVDETAAGNPVKYTAAVKTVPFLVRVLPYILLGITALFLFFFIFAQSQSGSGGRFNFGRSNARLYTKSNIKFSDLAGAEEEKEEMEELVMFLKDPKRFDALGARIPKGVLLVGPPGTGKTYLAKAVAGEAGVPFFNISGSDFVELYVGVGARAWAAVTMRESRR